MTDHPEQPAEAEIVVADAVPAAPHVPDGVHLRPTVYIAGAVLNQETVPALTGLLERRNARLVILCNLAATVPTGLRHHMRIERQGRDDVDFEARAILRLQRGPRRGAPFAWISRSISSAYHDTFNQLPGSPAWWIWKPWIGGLQESDLETADAWLARMMQRDVASDPAPSSGAGGLGDES